MDLPPEYVLHLLPLMAICGIPPPQTPETITGEMALERNASLDSLTASRPPSLASIPYIDPQIGRNILRLIEPWRTMALWEPEASKNRQVPGQIEPLFRTIPVDRVSPWKASVFNIIEFPIAASKSLCSG